MNNCDLQKDSMKALCETLSCCELKSISIWKNKIDKEGWQMLVDRLSGAPKAIKLKHIEFTREDMTWEQADFLSAWNENKPPTSTKVDIKQIAVSRNVAVINYNINTKKAEFEVKDMKVENLINQ